MAKFVYRTVALVAGLALWGAVPAMASATTTVWHRNAAPLTKAVSTSWKGTVKLEDSKAPLLGSLTVQCEDTAEGTVTSGGLGEVKGWTSSNCKPGTEKYACEAGQPITLTAVHLPWRVELAAAEGPTHAVVTSSGAGAPGFEMRCKVLGVAANDTCTGTLTTTTTNTSGGVTVGFKPAERLNCNGGGAGSGILEGSQVIGNGSREKLSRYTEHEPPEWAGGHNPLTKSSGTRLEGAVMLKTTSVEGFTSVGCEDIGTGKVGSKGAGELTTFTASHCKAGENISACREESAMTIEAVNLPWTTELVIVGGVTEDRLLSSGKGEPIFRMKCSTSAGSFTAECGGLPALPVENTYPDAVVTYEGEPIQGVSCNTGGGAGTIAGSQTIGLTDEELLEVI